MDSTNISEIQAILNQQYENEIHTGNNDNDYDDAQGGDDHEQVGGPDDDDLGGDKHETLSGKKREQRPNNTSDDFPFLPLPIPTAYTETTVKRPKTQPAEVFRGTRSQQNKHERPRKKYDDFPFFPLPIPTAYVETTVKRQK